MPRFYFNIRDGTTLHPDHEGSVLPDLAAVRREVLQTLAEMARDVLPLDVKRRDLAADVRDATGRLVLTADLTLVARVVV